MKIKQLEPIKTFSFLFPLFLFAVAPGQQTGNQWNHPWGREGQFRGHMGHRPLGGHTGHQNSHLEEEVQRLSQMVLDMQARMTDMASSLRLDFQEDASKMLVSLMNNIRQPASVRGAETQTVEVQGFSLNPTAMDDVMNRISQVADNLESKSSTLNELVSRVSRHDGQIHLLMEASQNHLPTPPPAPPPASNKDLRDYLDEKIHALREELMEGMDIKLADLKNSCDYKILSVQEQCEGQETNYLSLAELMESKESDLRKEIQDLETKLVGSGKGGLLSSDTVLVRVENLESRLNSSEKTAAAQCLSVEEKLKLELVEAITDLRETLEDKLASVDKSSIQINGLPEHQDDLQRNFTSLKGSIQILENRCDVLEQQCSNECKANLTVLESIQQTVDAMETQLKVQINDLIAMEEHHLNFSTSMEDMHSKLSHLKGRMDGLEDSLSGVHPLLSLNSTWGQSKTGAEEEAKDLLDRHKTQQHELRNQLDKLAMQVKANTEHCRGKTEDIRSEITSMDSRIVTVESLCGKLDPISASLQRFKDGLDTHVTALWTCVNQLNGTVRAQARDIGGLRGTWQNLVSNLPGDLQTLTDNNTGMKGKMETLEFKHYPVFLEV